MILEHLLLLLTPDGVFCWIWKASIQYPRLHTSNGKSSLHDCPQEENASYITSPGRKERLASRYTVDEQYLWNKCRNAPSDHSWAETTLLPKASMIHLQHPIRSTGRFRAMKIPQQQALTPDPAMITPLLVESERRHTRHIPALHPASKETGRVELLLRSRYLSTTDA